MIKCLVYEPLKPNCPSKSTNDLLQYLDCSLMQTNVCILFVSVHHPSNQCAMHSLGATPAQLMDGQITKSPSRERDIPCHHICKSNPFAKVIHISQVPYTSDRQKQCFTVLAEPNRTSQLKFCFPNRNRTEPNMKICIKTQT